MLRVCDASRIVIASGLIALAGAAALAPPRHALAQEATPAAGPPVERVIARDEAFPLWDALTGIGTVGLAVAALYAAFVSLRQYLQQRRRQTVLDLAQLQGDLVALLREGYQRARGTVDEHVRREELEKAEDVFEGILRGRILVEPEIMKAAREALTEYLKLATSELESLRWGGG